MKNVFKLVLAVSLSCLLSEVTIAADITSKELSVNDVKPMYEKIPQCQQHPAVKDFKIDEFLGVYQEGNKATLFYKASVTMNNQRTSRLRNDTCVRFNDGRWYCIINVENCVSWEGFLSK
jgi:hypothetical protein